MSVSMPADDPLIGPGGNGGARKSHSHADLVAIASRWLKRRCSVVFTEFSAAGAYENPDAIGWQAKTSILIECKVSRSDFRSDRKKMVRRFAYNGMGRYRYFLCPAGLIRVEDLPDKWGLLWAKGRRVYVQHNSEPFREIGLGSEIAFLVSMLRRAQVRLGDNDLAEWLRYENMP